MDCGRPGSKMHILPDANGLPLVVFAANVHDSEGLKLNGGRSPNETRPPQRPLFQAPTLAWPARPTTFSTCGKWLRCKWIGVRIARKVIESSERLGRRRWGIERTISRLSGYRRLSPRYERHPRNYLAHLGLAAALCCCGRLVRLTT